MCAEPGYVTTPICVVQAAYVLLNEQNKLPKGYYTLNYCSRSVYSLPVHCIPSRCVNPLAAVGDISRPPGRMRQATFVARQFD